MKIVYLMPLILAGCAPVIRAPLPPAPPVVPIASPVRPVPATPSVQTQRLEPKPKPIPAAAKPTPPKPKPDVSTTDDTDSGDAQSSQVATGEKVGTCQEGSWWGLIGRPRSAASIVSEPKRVYTEGDPVTMDNKPERTNIVLDESGKIAKVTCG